MERAGAWASFIGSWLLVAGPLFQGSIELHRIELSTRTPGSRPASRWWWLLPPVMYVLTRRRIATHRRGSEERLFRATGTGWFVVSAGGALIAVQATQDLLAPVTESVLPVAGTWIGMLALSMLHTSVRMIRERGRTDPVHVRSDRTDPGRRDGPPPW